MDKKLKSILKSQIESYLQKTPHSSDGKIIKWLYIGAVPGPDTLNAIKKESLRSIVVYQKKKFAMHGFCADHLKGNGRPSVSGRKIAQVVFLGSPFKNIPVVLPTSTIKICGKSVKGFLSYSWFKPRQLQYQNLIN